MQIRAEPLEHFAEVAHRWNKVLLRIGRCVCVWLPVWGGFDAVRTPTPDEWQNMALVSVISGTRALLNWMELPYTVPLIKRIREVNQRLQQVCEVNGLGDKTWCRPNPVDESRFTFANAAEKAILRQKMTKFDSEYKPAPME